MSTHHGHHQHHSHPAPPSAAETQRQQASLDETIGVADVVYELEARECEWEIAPGRVVQAWGYNGQVPGPVLEATVGQVMSVRLKNSLPEPTTIHWHGLRVTPAMDGTAMVQRPIQPGETFEYRFRVPDAGTFWYHPHSNETVQMERGLAGALIVRGEDEPVLDRERILVLDDVKLDRSGSIAKKGGLMERHNGREGDVRLVNGRQEPELTVAAGQVERWRIVNAGSARYIVLSIGGLPFRILGTDGGLIEAPVETTQVLLAPSDRIDIAVGPFEEGATIPVEALAYNRMAGKARTQRFATVHVGAPAGSNVVIKPRMRAIEPLVSGTVQPTREVHLAVKPSLRRGLDFVINGERHHRDQPVRVGELQVWDVINDSLMDHPFHLHGFFFQVVDVNGSPPAFRSWEDTVNVPPRSRVRIAWLPDDRPGEWMYHCHIVEHHDAGMMAHFSVVR
jgi:FtsP/CotA-like multicopper oxidase with cupredoxin domain